MSRISDLECIGRRFWAFRVHLWDTRILQHHLGVWVVSSMSGISNKPYLLFTGSVAISTLVRHS